MRSSQLPVTMQDSPITHSILLSLLSGMAITGSGRSWFESYISAYSFRLLWQAGFWLLTSFALGSPEDRPIIRCYADDTQLNLSFPPDKHLVSSCLLQDLKVQGLKVFPASHCV